jgi:copper resistance protein C
MLLLRDRVVLFLAVAVLATFATLTEAHAILKASSPASGASLAGPDVPISLTFNVRVDAGRSKLQLLLPDASTVDLPLEKQSGADKLDSRARDLKPGAYKIRWQVLAPDGHISRGEIPFQVTAP